MRERHLLFFDPYSQGHHAEYLLHLLEYWIENDYAGHHLDLVVSPRLLEWAPRLADVATRNADRGIRLIPEPEAVSLETTSRFGLLHTGVAHRALLRRHVLARRPEQVLLLYFDHAQPALALDLRFDFPVRFSGIYFRPTLHYGGLAGSASGPRARLTEVRKRLLLAGALRNRHLDLLFSLDPFAVPAVERLARHTHVVALPEPYTPAAASRPAAVVRAGLGIGADRKVLLHFGVLGERKGVYEALEAFLHLTPAETERLALVLAGPLVDIDEGRLRGLLRRVEAETRVQLVTRLEKIPAETVQDLFGAADLALMPYQGHVGSSSVLVRAAHAGIPVLGPEYGMLGAVIRRHRLGQAVDAARPEALAEGLRHFLDAAPGTFFDAAELRRYAEANTASAYAGTIFRHLDARLPAPTS